MITCDWDPEKAALGFAKHKVPFEWACLVFEALTVEVEDTRYSYPERRYQAYGYIEGRLFQCVYTWKDEGRTRWVISFRKCNEREVKRYG